MNRTIACLLPVLLSAVACTAATPPPAEPRTPGGDADAAPADPAEPDVPEPGPEPPPGDAARPVPPTPSNGAANAIAPVEPAATGVVTSLCGHAREAAIRRRLGAAGDGLPACAQGVEASFVETRVGGHAVVVAAYRDERMSWVDGPVLYGSVAAVDGEPVGSELLGPAAFWKEDLGDLSGIDADTARGLLAAVALTHGFRPLETLDDTEAAIRGWPEAVAFVRSRPPGFAFDDEGARLRVWFHVSDPAMGGSCQELSRLELAIVGGTVVVHPGASWARGEELGLPCGPPVPSVAGGEPEPPAAEPPGDRPAEPPGGAAGGPCTVTDSNGPLEGGESADSCPAGFHCVCDRQAGYSCAGACRPDAGRSPETR